MEYRWRDWTVLWSSLFGRPESWSPVERTGFCPSHPIFYRVHGPGAFTRQVAGRIGYAHRGNGPSSGWFRTSVNFRKAKNVHSNFLRLRRYWNYGDGSFEISSLFLVLICLVRYSKRTCIASRRFYSPPAHWKEERGKGKGGRYYYSSFYRVHPKYFMLVALR